MIDPLLEIERLARFERRGPGTDAERRAANHLRQRLEAIGRDARVESTSVLPRFALAQALHAIVAIAGSAVSVVAGLAGAIVVAVATVSALAETAGGVRLASRLTGRRASQNVVSEERSLKPGTLILTAHYDAGRGGLLSLLERRMAPWPLLVLALLVTLGCAVARAVGAGGTGIAIPQFAAAVVLILLVPLLLDEALSETVPGANDNASGVATALRLAERYGAELEHFDVWVLLPGASEAGQQGMRAWFRRHRKELDPRRTVVLNVDEVARGGVRYLRREGPLLRYRYHPQLVALCDELRDEGVGGAEPATRRRSSDGHAARAARIPAITVTGVPAPDHHRPEDRTQNVDEDALERAVGFCSELVELVDERLGPALPELPSEAFSSA